MSAACLAQFATILCTLHVATAFFFPNFDANVVKRHVFPELEPGLHPVPSDLKSSPQLVQHHCLLPPMLKHFDTTGFELWDLDGSAVVTDDYVRLTPAVQSRHGCLWNKVPNELDEWSFRVGLRVSGPNKNGADGLALWYTKHAHCTGADSIFGVSKKFEGIGILLDTYDNDHRKDNPQVHVISPGDNHDADADFMTSRLGGCQFDYRKVSAVSVIHVTVTYSSGTLSVKLGTFDTGLVECAALDVVLPTGFYFGVSALTGGLADEHDIYYLAAASTQDTAEDHNALHKYSEERVAKALHGMRRQQLGENID